MINQIREFINKRPWLGWVVALLMVGVSAFVYMRRTSAGDAYSPDRMREVVTIRFADTNDEITMTRGKLDQELRRRGDKLDPNEGVVNPKTGKPTGFPFDKSEWEKTIARINEEKAEIRSTSGKSVAPAPRGGGQISPETAKILETAPAAPSAPSAPGAPPAPSPK